MNDHNLPAASPAVTTASVAPRFVVPRAPSWFPEEYRADYREDSATCRRIARNQMRYAARVRAEGREQGNEVLADARALRIEADALACWKANMERRRRLLVRLREEMRA